MFSDILTPLPALGIEFDVVRGSGPIIEVPIRRSAPSLTPNKQQTTLSLQMTASSIHRQLHLRQSACSQHGAGQGLDAS